MHLYRGRLGDAPGLYADDRFSASPQNWWIADRSWLVYTDWDLTTTTVCGEEELIEAVVNTLT